MKKLTALGTFDITVLDQHGNIREHVIKHNRVVDGGLACIASLLAGSENDDNFIDRPQYLAIGSESNDVKSSDDSLVNELYRKKCDRVERQDNTVQFTTTYQPNEPDNERITIREVGLFDKATDGTMFNRCVFSQIAKYRSDTVIVKYLLTIAAQETVYDDVDDIPDETPPVVATRVTVTINQPKGGMITVIEANGTRHQATFDMLAGNSITIQCAANKGYQIDNITFGGTSIDNNDKRNVVSNVTIGAVLSKIPPTYYHVVIDQPTGGVIIATDKQLVDYSSSFDVVKGSKLTVTCEPSSDRYTLQQLYYNDKPIDNESVITVNSDGKLTADMIYHEIDNTRVITLVTDGNGIIIVNNGEQDYTREFTTTEGTKLKVTAVPNEGYELQSLQYRYTGDSAPEESIGVNNDLDNESTISADYSMIITAKFTLI